MYASIPDITGMIGGALGAAAGGAAGIPGGPGAIATGGFLGGTAGAWSGGMAGRAVQFGIDTVLDRPPQLQNPENLAGEANEQMLNESMGRAVSGIFSRFFGAGRLSQKLSAEGSERLATSEQYDLQLSPGEISDNPGVRRAEALAQRGLGGFARQKAAQARTDAAAQRAVNAILDGMGQAGSETGTGAIVKETIGDATTRASRRLEGSVASNLAPATGMGATGEAAEAGVQAGRTAFSRQGEAFSEIIKNAPAVNMEPLHNEALRLLREQIMPAMMENPTLGPKTEAWKRLVNLYQRTAATGERFELGPADIADLQKSALKSTYAPMKVISMALATPKEMTFQSAIKLRSLLREAGKGGDLLGKSDEALATYLETGSRTSEWRGLRGMLADTEPLYEQAAEALATNRNLFESALVEKVVASNPESVLATMTNAEGKFNASRIRQMQRVLQDLPRTYGTPAEQRAGRKAWDTLRAEWFRRDVMKDDVFGMAERMRKVDPDVLQAWFPDLAGKNVQRQAQVTAKAFESQLLGKIATEDPAKVVSMIGASPARVNEFTTAINGLPGPVEKAALIDRVRRSWTDSALTAGDPDKLAGRIAKTDPDLLKAWFSSPRDQAALESLKRIGNALSTRRPVVGMGAYESLGAVSVVGNLMRGNFGGALKTAVGFEGLPAFFSWAMYNPTVQKHLFEAASPMASVTSRTSALLHVVGAYRSAEAAEKDAQGLRQQ